MKKSSIPLFDGLYHCITRHYWLGKEKKLQFCSLADAARCLGSGRCSLPGSGRCWNSSVSLSFLVQMFVPAELCINAATLLPSCQLLQSMRWIIEEHREARRWGVQVRRRIFHVRVRHVIGSCIGASCLMHLLPGAGGCMPILHPASTPHASPSRARSPSPE